MLTFSFLVPLGTKAQISEGIEPVQSVSFDKVHTKTEVEASFPGGKLAGNKHFYSYIDKNRKVLNADGKQFCYLKFVVDIEGNISEITANKTIQTKLDEVVIKALKAGPKWVPARHNGVKVKAYASLTFIFEPGKSRKTAYAKNSVNYFVTKENRVEKQFKKILIMVAGKAPVRIFTDSFYESLKEDLKSKYIETEYIFLGNDEKLAQDNFMYVRDSKTFDAILLFIQGGEAKIKERYYGPENVLGPLATLYYGSESKNEALSPNNYGSGMSIRSLSINQSMNIFLIDSEDLNTPIMEAKVFMNFQLMKKSAYSKAAKDFLELLQKNGVANPELLQ